MRIELLVLAMSLSSVGFAHAAATRPTGNLQQAKDAVLSRGTLAETRQLLTNPAAFRKAMHEELRSRLIEASAPQVHEEELRRVNAIRIRLLGNRPAFDSPEFERAEQRLDVLDTRAIRLRALSRAAADQ